MDSRVREAIWSLEEQQASSQDRRRGRCPQGVRILCGAWWQELMGWWSWEAQCLPRAHECVLIFTSFKIRRK